MSDILGTIHDPDVTLAPPSQASMQPAVLRSGGSNIIGSIHDQDVESQDEHFGTPGQQIAAGLEGLAEGVAGPLAPLAEQKLGISTGENIRARAQANPVTHYGSQLAALAGSTLIPGLGEASLAGQVGKIGKLAEAGVEGLGAGKIIAQGIKTGAEMAALSTSDELSKMVTHDPNQTLGSAAINIGLSGIIGGVTGGALGTVSTLWQKSKNVLGVDKLISDFQIETKALQQAKERASGVAFEDLLGDSEAIPASSSSKSPGVLLARWANEKGAQTLAKAAGETVSSTIGAGLGALAGHPIAGAWMGEKALNQVFTSLAKPLAEGVLDSTAAKATVEYVGNAIRGQKILSDGVANLFAKGSEVLAKDLIPDQESRTQLKKALYYAENPQNAFQIGGKIGHYLPSHATAASQTASQALNYLNTLKPTQPKAAPLDQPAPINPAQEAKYNRALDIAQQPLMVLEHVKNATLIPQDVQALQTMYPGVHKNIVQLATNQLINSQAPKLNYAQRVSLNLLMGEGSLDSTMTPMAMQAIMHSSSPQSQRMAQETQTGQPHGKASSTELSQINKVNALSLTPLQNRARQRRS